jgi:hypothetical protein
VNLVVAAAGHVYQGRKGAGPKGEELGLGLVPVAGLGAAEAVNRQANLAGGVVGVGQGELNLLDVGRKQRQLAEAGLEGDLVVRQRAGEGSATAAATPGTIPLPIRASSSSRNSPCAWVS